MSKVSIALATEAQAAACLALLPEFQGLPAELLIASQDGRLAGAAGVVWQSWAKPAGFPFLAHVMPAMRRRGVGRALVAAALALTAGETDGLWSMEPIDLDAPAAAFLEACGFELRRRQHFFQARTEAMGRQLAPLVDRMRDRGRVPAGVEVVPLRGGLLEEISWLMSAEFGGGPFRALHGLHHRSAPEGSAGADRSQVVLHEGKVAAVLMGRMAADGVLVIEARVVAPRWRGDWPNLFLLDAAVHQAVAQGVPEFRFHCDEAVKDTLSLARRCDAREVARKGLFYYAATAA